MDLRKKDYVLIMRTSIKWALLFGLNGAHIIEVLLLYTRPPNIIIFQK